MAVQLLAQGHTIREVARTLGVSEKTIYNYRQNPIVQRHIYIAQQDMVAQSGGRNLSTVPDAVRTLTEIANDPQARHADRIAASRALISSANAFSERRILERQLADLEAALRRFTSPETVTSAEPLDLLMPSAALDPDEA